MIVICGGLMRTGSVAMFQIMREIVETQAVGFAPVMPHDKEVEFWEENIGDWTHNDTTVVTKLHRWMDLLSPYKNGVKVVMTIRDMRDVTVSLMNFRGGGFEPAIHSNAFKGNIEGQAEWEEKVPADNLLKIRYEDFIRIRAVTTKQVADFMGISLQLSEAMKIEQKWNINANLRRSLKSYVVGHPEFMSPRHIQSGKVGQWKETLTHEQILEVQDRVGHDWFIENDYILYE